CDVTIQSPSAPRHVLNLLAPNDIYTLSLHDALPISAVPEVVTTGTATCARLANPSARNAASRSSTRTCSRSKPCRSAACRAKARDRKSTRLNSSHVSISYAVFCLKKKQRRYLYCNHR